MELQQLILMEKEIMDLDGIEILLPVGPEKTLQYSKTFHFLSIDLI